MATTRRTSKALKWKRRKLNVSIIRSAARQTLVLSFTQRKNALSSLSVSMEKSASIFILILNANLVSLVKTPTATTSIPRKEPLAVWVLWLKAQTL